MRINLFLLLSSVFIINAPCFAQTLQMDGYRAEYKGGTFATKGDSGRLFISADSIELVMKQGENVEILSKNVTALSYGSEASRRAGLWVGLAAIHPAALFGLLTKKRDHYVGIEYRDKDGKAGAILIKAHKSEYMAMLLSLHSVTGQKVIGVMDKPRKKDDWTKMKEDR